MFNPFKKKDPDNKEEIKEEDQEKKEDLKDQKVENNDKDETETKPDGFLSCHFIFEVIGKPAGFIEKTLAELMGQLKKEKGIKIKSVKQNPPEAHKEKPEIFCVFSEVELYIPNLRRLVELLFDYMPSSIEIYEPSELKMQAAECNSVINELALKLHQYDISNKQILYEKNIIFKKLQELKQEMEKNKAEKTEISSEKAEGKGEVKEEKPAQEENKTDNQ